MAEDRETLAVVVNRLDDLKDDIKQIRDEVHTFRADVVSRGEWGQRNDHVDTRLNSLGREVGDLRTQIETKKVPWPTVVAVVVSIVGFVWVLIGPAVLQSDNEPTPRETVYIQPE